MKPEPVTFCIPDPHERLDKVREVLALVRPTERVVFLGDWFDTFKPWDEDRVYSVCSFITNNIDNPRYTFLLGNHDVHYINDNYACSGWNPKTLGIVRHAVSRETWLKFKVFTRVGKYTLSHAGFCPETVKYAEPNVCDDAVKKLVARDGIDPLFGAGKARGGPQWFGGPTWLDWNYEFDEIAGFPQIVGHTADKAPRQKGESHCIDTHSKHYAMIVDDKVSVYAIDAPA